MYQKDHLSLPLGKYEVKIPNWFLREKGALSRDVFLRDHTISIPKFNSTLLIKNINELENIFQIGSFSYRINTKQIDLQDILTNPFYWLGNVELVEFAGQGIFRWYRKTEAERDIEFVERINTVNNDDQLRKNFERDINGKRNFHFRFTLCNGYASI